MATSSGIKRKFAQMRIDIPGFLEATGAQFRYVSGRRWKDKKGKLPDGHIVVLQILKDNGVYGPGEDSMVFETFQVYVVDGSSDLGLVKGDYCTFSPDDFIPEHSYYIDFSFIIRLKSLRKIQVQKSGGSSNATDQKQ